jgi:mRNA degradation ribonuclease J1/J2
MDHISGFELLAYYGETLNHYFNVYAPIEFKNIYENMGYKKTIEENRISFNWIKKEQNIIVKDITITPFNVQHMGLEAYGFIFTNKDMKRIIISGDTEFPFPGAIGKKDILFQDMGWTGVTVKAKKAHPTEEDIFKFFGWNENIYGIHINDGITLKQYKKAKEDKVYEI